MVRRADKELSGERSKEKNRRPVRGGGLAAEGTKVPLFQFYQSTWVLMPKPLIVPPPNLATGPDLGCVDRGVLVGVLVIDLEASTDFEGKLLPVPTQKLRRPIPGDLEVELFSVPGKVALYLEDDDPALAAETGANVGVEVACGDRRLLYVPGAAAVNADLRERLDRADVVLFDATLFVDDEMILSGTGDKTGRRMGHMPLDGADGTLAALGGLRGRRILTHINNTNPILIKGSAERRKVEAAGFEVAEDGMEIVL